ncbi:ninein isoform X4 [Entelurus aequoreus]|uniref:ninein isoform X4 n=1 Tax=Entelurus aequoreus TaxID=161455 RepID=UPI002B1D62C3|nr:ninein isoform X4 [Entelurus aequoreus]
MFPPCWGRRVLSCGMDEQDHYEERLKELFSSFDAAGCGSLCPEELADLCLSLHLDDATPALLDSLLHNQDRLTARVDFHQFKDALILVLSSGIEAPRAKQDPPAPRPESPEIQPKFVKGSKRYGRRSAPVIVDTNSDLCEDEADSEHPDQGHAAKDNYDSAIPRKRERWNAVETSTEEYQAEGQMHLWNPDEPSTPGASVKALRLQHLEARFQEACEDLAISWDGCADHADLLALCDCLGLEISADVVQSLNGDRWINVQDFVSMVLSYSKPATPSASTPYRQLKRHHSTQPFDEVGRRIATPSALIGTIGTRLFSTLDDGTGFTPVESVMDAWMEEGIENSTEILQALNFSLDGKLSLCDLTAALENELLVTKNGVHQAALASFKAEIRHLLERVDGELREKEKLRSDLEKAERLKNQLATEVDEHHSSIEHTNNLNLRKLEQDHREKLATVRSELMKEMDQIRLQATQQREELEAEMEKIRDDETFLRDHLSISVKENRHLEMELLDCSEKLTEAQSQVAKLQASLDNIMKEKFGDLEPSSADVFFQERIKQLRLGYEAQCRELQDRVDELQSEVRDLHSLGRTQQPCHKPLSEELESKSPGMESDPGLGSEEVHPFSMSLEAEMMLEQQKEQHLHQMDELRNQLECKINEFSTMLEQQRVTNDNQKEALALQYQQEVQALREELVGVELRTQELQSKLEQAELELAEESEKLEEMSSLRLQLLEAQTRAGELEEQLRNLQEQPVAQNLLTEMEELRKQHESAIKTLEKKNMELLETRLKEERSKHQEEKGVLEKSWLGGFEREKQLLRQSHQEEIRTRLEEARSIFEEEQGQTVQMLTKEWQKEQAQLDEKNNESLQAKLEEEMLKLVREQEEKESQLQEQWESERAQLLQHQEEALLNHVAQERLRLREEHEHKEMKLKQEWDDERLQLEDDYEAMLQERLDEEREKHQAEKEAMQKRLQGLLDMKRARQEESHGEAMRELAAKHAEERNSLSGMLDKLRDQVAQERQHTEVSFSQKIEELERRFSADQESVAERFEADVAKLEQHYQSELKWLSESHAGQKLLWEAQLQRALEGAEEQREQTEDAMEREAERRKQEWTQEQLEMKRVHEEVVEAMVKKNQQLNHEMESIKRTSKTKETELNRQLNDLHNRLQESAQTKEQLLAQSDRKATDIELLLSQTVEDFRQEREELQNSHFLLEAKYKEMLSISERQTVERIELLTERDDFKLRIEEMEKLLKQAADDFEVDREELQEHVAILEEKLKGSHAKNVVVEKARNATLETKILHVSCPSQGIVEDTVIETDAVETNTEDILLIGQEPCEERDTMPQVTIKSSENQDQVQISDLRDLWIHNAEMCDDPQAFSSDESEDDPEECLGTKEENSEMTTCKPEDSESNEDKKEASTHRELQIEDFDLSLKTSRALEAHKGEHEPAPGLETPSHQNKPDKESNSLVHVDSSDLSLDADDNPGSDIGEPVDQDVVFELQSLYLQAKDDNVLLQEKISLLQQKTDLLQSLLEHNNMKIQTGHEHLEENYSLKVKLFLLIEHIKVLEMKAFKLKELQVLYEDCLCENADLKEQNSKLNKRVWSLERNISPDFHDEPVSPLDQISVMREENCKLAELFREFDINPGSPERPSSSCESSTLKDCCCDGEVNATSLHKDISELQGDDAGTQASSSAAVRLAEENVSLKHEISSLQEEDLKQAQEDLTHTLEQLNQGKVLAEQAAEDFNKQMSDLCSQSRRLQSENGTLAQKNARSLTDVGTLKKQLAELMKDSERKEAFTGEEKRNLTTCVSSLEAELTGALEDMARLEERNSQLARQVSKLQEKVKTMDESHKRVCLKSDLRLMQQDRDSFLQEVAVLQRQLQNANDKNHVLEMALHSRTPNKKLHREEEDDQLRPDATSFLSHMQHRASPSSVIKALEQENASLKQEVDSQKLVIKGQAAREGLAGMKKLLEENEALKGQVERLTSQLLESYRTHFVGLLPASPRRTARGHHVDGVADNAQDGRERRMASMEERMKEIEVSLRNVKMLLREKVAQLKDQVHKNSVADVLIRDLYSENTQLLKALEASKRRRQKMAEKSEEDMLDLHSKVCCPILPNLMTSPTSNLMTSPTSNLLTSPTSNLLTSPTSNLLTSPTSNLLTSPTSNLLTSPTSNLLTSPTSNLLTSPTSNLLTSPTYHPLLTS